MKFDLDEILKDLCENRDQDFNNILFSVRPLEVPSIFHLSAIIERTWNICRGTEQEFKDYQRGTNDVREFIEPKKH